MQQITLTIKGKVQGVFFRAETREKALQLGLKGFATNNPDGTVIVCAQGQPEDLQKLIKWCRQGPERAQVEDIKIESQSLPDFTFQDFEIG